ncbi:MAG: hypothetical protein H7839_00930 [Magnetococcus sp. YQC-5]
MGCDKIKTTITSVIPAGWTVHDANAGVGNVVIKSPLADNASAFKYVGIYTGAAGIVLTIVYETFNAVNHTSTNQCIISADGTYNQRVSIVAGGTMHIFASARFVMLASFVDPLWGSSLNAGPSGCFERTRACPWDTVAAGYPPFLFCNLGSLANPTYNYSAEAPRFIDRVRTPKMSGFATLAGYTGPFGGATSADQTVGAMLSTLYGMQQRVPNNTPNDAMPFFPISFANTSFMPVPYGEISSLCDIWALPGGTHTNLTTVTKGGLDYLCLQAYDTTRMFVIRKG